MRRTSTVKRHLGVLVLLFASLSGCVAAPVDGEAVAVVASAPKPALNSVAGNYLAGRFAQDQHDQGAAAEAEADRALLLDAKGADANHAQERIEKIRRRTGA